MHKSGRISNLLLQQPRRQRRPLGRQRQQHSRDVPQAQTSIQGTGPLQTSLGNLGPIATSYGAGDNYSSDRQQVQDALMARINPQLDIQKQQLQQQLADQGIRYGSAAYNNAFTPFNQQANDARFGAMTRRPARSR